VGLSVTDSRTFLPVETGIHLLAAFARELRAAGAGGLVADRAQFRRLAGTERLAVGLDSGLPAADIIASWRDEVAAFRSRRARYLIY
jgi:uncharacterized protein YbbC (DUF1343 family)